ncbi:MAG TPA: S24/S26 family peptidase [Segeticoccus sp.]|jgi:hypothetical protein|nr:S24/S26 family peptidase [Segeticoccus sp.]
MTTRRRSLGLAVVRGRSMEPTLLEGDRLLVLYAVPPRRGGLALVRLPDGPDGPRPLAVKRVHRREADGWWVEGDNLGAGVDSWTVGTLPDSGMVARVLLRLPRRGRLARGGRRE